MTAIISKTGKISKYGNSYCVIIPKGDVESLGLEGKRVRVEIHAIGDDLDG